MSNAHTDSRRPVIIGEVLLDRFPDGTAVLGGAPFNVAWHLQGFGAAPLFVSRVGDDEAGGRVRAAMQAWGMDQVGLQLDTERPTGTVEVAMSDGQHSFDILPDQAYDHMRFDSITQATHAIQPALIYQGSLIMRTPETRTALTRFLEQVDVPVFVDINLRDPWWRTEDVSWLLQRAKWAKVNDDELTIIARELGMKTDGMDETVRELQDRFAIDLLILTLGREGARAFQYGSDPAEVAPELVNDVVDTVGAGDAFASVSLLGLLKGWPLKVTMHRAQQFASRIVQQRGATDRDHGLYQRLLQQWNSIQ